MVKHNIKQAGRRRGIRLGCGTLATKLKRAHHEPLWNLFTKFHRNRPVGLGCGASLYKQTDRQPEKPDNKGYLTKRIPIK